MTFQVERMIGGQKFFVNFPMSEFIQWVDMTFTCNVWPDRLSDCYINGRLVNQYIYKRERDGWKSRPRSFGVSRRPLAYALRA